MEFLRRLKFYGFGFALGLLVVYAIFGNRSCSSVNELKVAELRYQYFRFSDLAKCKLKCMNISEEVFKLQLRHFEVNYDLSKVHQKPCGEYYLEPKEEHSKEYNFKLVVLDCDTISTINDISVTSTPSCQCQ